jgi:hypothetical protein
MMVMMSGRMDLQMLSPYLAISRFHSDKEANDEISTTLNVVRAVIKNYNFVNPLQLNGSYVYYLIQH